jgi:hypothetical protein
MNGSEIFFEMRFLSTLGDLAVELARRHWYVTLDTTHVCGNLPSVAPVVVFCFRVNLLESLCEGSRLPFAGTPQDWSGSSKGTE